MSRAPFHLRTMTTICADALAFVLAALCVEWAVGALPGLPVFNGLFTVFAAKPIGGLFTLIALTPYWIAALWAFGLYRESGRSIGGMSVTDALGGFTALTSASWLLLVIFLFTQGTGAPVAALIVFWFAAVLLVPSARWLVRTLLWSRSSFKERVLIVGAGEVGHSLAAKISKHPEYKIDLIGYLDNGEPCGSCDDGPPIPILGVLNDLERVIAQQDVHRVIVAFSQARHDDFLRVVRACSDSYIQVNIVPRLFEVVSSRALVDDVEGIPLLDIGHAELSRFNMAVKRVFDLIVGSVICLFALPVMAVIALAIKLDSKGPVLFRQERMGRGWKTFEILKFRSMAEDAESRRHELEDCNECDGPIFKIRKDPRITRVGGVLRRWSLDELPQILNVMKGDMSLVGPRPLWVKEARQCGGWTQKRLDITPGMTGLWQVLGRSDIPFDEMVKLDYMYVTGWSLSWDIKLLFQTFSAVTRKRGAY